MKVPSEEEWLHSVKVHLDSFPFFIGKYQPTTITLYTWPTMKLKKKFNVHKTAPVLYPSSLQTRDCAAQGTPSMVQSALMVLVSQGTSLPWVGMT